MNELLRPVLLTAWLCNAAFVAESAGAAAMALDLVRDGQPVATIVIPAQPLPVEYQQPPAKPEA